MHEGELHLDDDTARALVTEQFPEWRHERIRRVATAGTVNAVFRIGSGLAARFPLQAVDRRAAAAAQAREIGALSELAACCPFPTPLPVAVGRPGHGYPMPWTVQTWIPGRVATASGSWRSDVVAQDLVTLIRAFRSAPTHGREFCGSGRGGALQDSDAWMETCFTNSAGLLPVDRLRALWAELRTLPDGGAVVMTHGDLIPTNLLIEDDRLVGVLDGGGFGPADPALDLVVAWHLLDDRRRAIVRSGLECDALEWRRGMAWAFQQAMGLVWYYRRSDPGMSELGRTTLTRILQNS